MPTVEPFSRDMIERYLKQHNLKFLKYEDGDFQVQFGFDSDWGAELEVNLSAEGKNTDVYTLRVSSTRFIPRNDWGRAITLCNTWNKDKRWPKAYLRVRDPSTDDHGSIYLEEELDLETGIHFELFDDFTSTVIATAMEFWRWAHQEVGM